MLNLFVNRAVDACFSAGYGDFVRVYYSNTIDDKPHLPFYMEDLSIKSVCLTNNPLKPRPNT